MKTRLLALTLVLLASLPVLAIEVTGSISGTARDSQGSPLAGVTVSVTAPVLQGTRTGVTKADGTYSLTRLPPGRPYSVTFALAGFRNVEVTGLDVFVGKDTQVNGIMDLAPVSADVVVSGERPTVDVTQTNIQQNFSSEYLRKIPVGSGARDYLTIAQQAPLVVGTGNSNVAGGNLLENSYLIDGVNTTDPVTHTFTENLNFDAIQDIQLQTASYLPEFGRATGGILNVITKSGGNDFHGNADIRYSNNHWTEKGAHFDPGVSESRNTPWDVTLGGPILKDRLWFFGNLQRPDNFATPVVPNSVVGAQLPAGPVARSFKGWNSGGKLTLTATPQLTGLLEVQDSLATIGGSQNSALFRPEAQSTQHQRARIYEGVFNGIINTNWSAELQIARFEDHLDTAPTSGNLSTSEWINIAAGNVRYDNYFNFQSSDRNRNLLGVNTSYFFEGFGSHQIKVGGDADRTYFPSVNFVTGTPSDPSFCPAGLTCGARFQFRGFDAAGNRIPFQQQVLERQAGTERDGHSYAGFVQDQWRPITRLTLNLGVRFDRSEYFNNIGENVLNFNKWQPRVGIAYDVMGNGKDVFRASYGQFYIDPALTFARLFDTGINSGLSKIFRWNATTQRWVLVQTTGGNPITQALIDGPLKPTYDEQINAAFEHQILQGPRGAASAMVGYIYKHTKNIFEDSCTDQTNCPDFWITNQPGRDLGLHDVLKKNYYAYYTQMQFSGTRFYANASYAYSKSRGSIDSSQGQYAGSDFDHFPENFVNRYGFLDDDARHRVKLFAAYQIPFIETRFGVNYFYRTGLPYTDTHNTSFGLQFDEPRGSHRTPVLHTLNVELEKQFLLGRGISVSVIGSVLSLVNSEQPLTYFTSNDSPSTVNTPITYQRPRNYEAGFRIDF